MTASLGGATWAQAELNAPGLATNPQQKQPDEKRIQKQKEREAREAQRTQWQTQVLRDFLVQQGVADKDVQDAVIAHVEQRRNAQEGVRKAGAKFQQALSDKALPPAQIGPLVQEYRARQGEYTNQQQAAEAALDAKIGYSKDLRLEATLLLAGALGEGPSFIQAGSPPWAGGKGKGKDKGKNQPNNGAPQPAPVAQPAPIAPQQ